MVDRQEMITILDRTAVRRLLDFDGSSKASTWEPIHVRTLKSSSSKEFGERHRLKYSDAPACTEPVFRESAYRLLLPLLEGDGEFLPLRCDEAPLWMFNCTRFVDALDIEHSVANWFEFPTRAQSIKQYAFHADRLGDANAFRIPQARKGPLFFRENVAEAIIGAGLQRVGLRQVWPAADRSK